MVREWSSCVWVCGEGVELVCGEGVELVCVGVW